MTLTATVSPAAAMGSVTFLDGTSPLGSAPLNAGVATLPVPSLVPGNHSIKAVYGGTANYSDSTSAALIETVRANASAAVLQLPFQVQWGEPVQLTAIVSPSNSTGTVTFFDEQPPACPAAEVTLGSATISNSRATIAPDLTCTGVVPCWPYICTTSDPQPHTIWAAYSGDPDMAGSTSPAVTLYVAGKATKLLMGGASRSTISNANPPPGPLFTATISPSQAAGTVIFGIVGRGSFAPLSCKGSAAVPLVAGQAVCNAAAGMFPGPGSCGIQAMYNPSSDEYAESISYIGAGVTVVQ